MIPIKCETKEQCKIRNMTPFQGGLKVRSPKNRLEMRESLKSDGLLTPFMLWRHDNTQWILDGHGRREALIEEALTDVTILEQEFPCIFIEASTEEEARKAVVQICSTYGRISKNGVRDFTATITGYKAPLIRVKTTPVAHAVKKEEYVIIKLKVRKDKADALKDILKEVEGVSCY